MAFNVGTGRVKIDNYDPALEERINDARVATNGGRVVSDAPDAPDLLANLRNGAWLDAQNFPPLQFAVPGVIPEGFTLLAGAPKIGKSWMALDFALAIACGGRALGHIDVGPPKPVFALFLEDSDRRLQERARKLLDGAPIPEMFHYMTRVEPGSVLTTLRQCFAMYPEYAPLAIVDTLGKCMPPAVMGETTYSRDYRVGSAIKAIADDHPGSSVLVLHHDRKADSSDFVDSISGTNGLAGSADTVCLLTRNRHESEGSINVTSRDVREAEYAVELQDGVRWSLVGGALDTAASRASDMRVSAGLGDRSLEVLAFVRLHPEGVTPKQVDDALDMEDARQYLGRLAKKERIRNPKRGLYTPVTTVTLSQTDDDSRHSDTSDTVVRALDFNEPRR